MGTLLKQVIEKLSEMPPDEQDAYCAGLLKELEAENRWQRRFEETSDELAAAVARIDAEIDAGRSRPLERPRSAR
ncbi:MAG: hypothetical protein NBV67_19220 [Tagaea sp.]|nr:hypothetical protein [Tagaea sp.]